jgi:hypothetical protein
MNFLQRQLEDPTRFNRIKRLFYVSLAVVALAEIVLPRIVHGGHGGESHFAFEDFPAWGSLYGLISCVAIILVSKLIGKLWLMRREDYYDR